MSISIPFDNSYARLPAQLFTRLNPTPVKSAKLIGFNQDLADELGLRNTPDDIDLAEVFGGNLVPDGADPLAQLYAGHQFGHWNPQLGDGRALLLGEVVGKNGRRDIQLKGSGPTPYSRNGDGRAWLGPVLREYVVSEAMHALGIPSTRALAAVETGQPVQREKVFPGAVITRTAASHIRVGTFQILAARQELEGLEALYDHAVERHYPTAADPLDFLQSVIEAQAQLVVKWLSVGFIHGVMNTDNCTISGETIDYGPCAFMDNFHPMTVFSSIDRMGRYAYGSQPDIIVWNMAQLATALVPLMPDTDAAVDGFTKAVHAMPGRIQQLWLQTFGAKIGLSDAQPEDAAVINDLLRLMTDQNADFTNTFFALSQGNARDQFTDRAAYDAWHQDWETRLDSKDHALRLMQKTNPWIIPRNHQIEAMIQAAVGGDYAPFHRLNSVLKTPFTAQDGAIDLTRPPADSERVMATFCGT